MLYTRKNSEEYNLYAKQVVNYALKSGFEEIKADFEGYNSPASLSMVNKDVTLTPDFTAKKGENKYYFELVVKNPDEEDQNKLVSKWKALESIARMKGGNLQLFVPRGSYKYATGLVKDHGIDATLMKLNSL